MNTNKVKITTSPLFGDDTPPCPHCGGDMEMSLLTLGEVLRSIVSGDIGQWLDLDGDGYCFGTYESLEVFCLDCARPSIVRVHHGYQIYLIPTRTEKDRVLIAARAL